MAAKSRTLNRRQSRDLCGSVGSTDGQTGQAGVAGFSSADGGWGVKGSTIGVNAVGAEGVGPSVGVRGNALLCDNNGCTPANGDAGQFVAGAGGNLLHGFLVNSDGTWDEKFVADAAGNLSITGNAFKPGGGSWSVTSDRRAKKAVEPIGDALRRFLQLRGVTYEYVNPATLGELSGTHLGMVAQEVETVFPSWVDEGGDGYKRLTFRGFEALTVEAVRELDTKSQTTDARLSELEKQNAELQRQVNALSETLTLLRTNQR